MQQGRGTFDFLVSANALIYTRSLGLFRLGFALFGLAHSQI